MDADEEYRKSRLTKKIVCVYVCMYYVRALNTCIEIDTSHN